MNYIRPTQTGYDAFDCYHEKLFTENNCRYLFSFLEADTAKIRELLHSYFETVIDTENLSIKEEKAPTELVEDIKKEMKQLHPYLSTCISVTVFQMLAEHLNRVIFERNDQPIDRDSYDSLLRPLVMPLFSLAAHPLPPTDVPTSRVFGDQCYHRLRNMVEHSVSAAGLDYIEKVRTEAARYLYWVLDRSCFRFRDFDRDTRVRLYSRIFRTGILSSDVHMEVCCYLREPEQYDYFSHTPVGQLMNSMEKQLPIEEAESRMTESVQEKRQRKEMTAALCGVTDDRQEYTQEMKEFLDGEMDAVMSDATATMFEEYRIDSFAQLIRMQLWLLSKTDAVIKHCRHCGRLFLAPRLSSDYCSRINDGETEPCDIAGPKKAFARLMDEDHILKIYNRVYKTIYARKKRGSISDEAFCEWKTEARRMLDKTRAGGMTEEAFETWLTQDVRAWGTSGAGKE